MTTAALLPSSPPLVSFSPPPPSGPSHRTSSPSLRPRTPSSSSTTTASGGDELGLLRHQLRLLKAENLSLRERLGTKTNPAPFGSSAPRKSSLTPSLDGDRSGGGGYRLSTRTGSALSERSPNGDDRGRISPLPSKVGNAKALIQDSPPFPRNSPPVSPNPSSGSAGGGGTGGSTENPFFGGGNTRERMKGSTASAASGSGRVISGLQSELIQIKSALESAKGQLRLSQMAVDHLSRQNDDLKEAKERIASENEQSQRMLARKDRHLIESLSRLESLSSQLSQLQSTHTDLLQTSSTHIADLEASLSEGEERKARAEAEYVALRDGMKSMEVGWKQDLKWVKEDVGKVQARMGKELEDLRSRYSALEASYAEREAAHSDTTSILSKLSNAHRTLTQRCEALIVDLSSQSTSTPSHAPEEEGKRGEEALEIALELQKEFMRLRRMVKEADEKKYGELVARSGGD